MRKMITKFQWSIQCDRRLARFIRIIYVLCYTKTSNRNKLHSLRKTSAAVAVHNDNRTSFIKTRPFRRSRWRNASFSNDVRQTVEAKNTTRRLKTIPRQLFCSHDGSSQSAGPMKDSNISLVPSIGSPWAFNHSLPVKTFGFSGSVSDVIVPCFVRVGMKGPGFPPRFRLQIKCTNHI